jgi:hypothetical protein
VGGHEVDDDIDVVAVEQLDSDHVGFSGGRVARQSGFFRRGESGCAHTRRGRTLGARTTAPLVGSVPLAIAADRHLPDGKSAPTVQTSNVPEYPRAFLIFSGSDLRVEPDAAAAAGFMEPVDIENGEYDGVFDNPSLVPVVHSASWQTLLGIGRPLVRCARLDAIHCNVCG